MILLADLYFIVNWRTHFEIACLSLYLWYFLLYCGNSTSALRYNYVDLVVGFVDLTETDKEEERNAPFQNHCFPKSQCQKRMQLPHPRREGLLCMCGLVIKPHRNILSVGKLG